jgi:FAD synthetase
MASDAHFAAQLAAAAAVIDESFARWRPSEMALSFNGGKDCTVLLHMLGTSGRLDGLRVVFFDTEVGFPEITSFMQDMEVLYGFKCQSLGGFREGLAELVADGIKAVFLGTRRGDPHGGTQYKLF